MDDWTIGFTDPGRDSRQQTSGAQPQVYDPQQPQQGC